ncbi:MAG: type II toxin-antitoxin system VapB family antitoxin [Candidatus Fermentibacteraceae bacterium]
MRTTLDLPEELLDEAMRRTHIKTKTGVIIAALEELLRRHRISGIREYKGKIELDIDLDSLRDRACRY